MSTIAIIKPDATQHVAEILADLTRGGFTVDEVRSLRLTREEASVLYADHAGRPYFGAHVDFMASGPVVVLLLRLCTPVDRDSHEHARLRRIVGPTDPEAARREAPESIRARFGTVLPRNAIHASADEREACRDRDVLEELLGERGDYL